MRSFCFKLIGLLPISLLFAFCSSKNDLSQIPYPEALDRSNIKVTNLSNILNGSLIIGNGDINALVYADSNSVILNLTKNDVWDARLETERDPPIPTIQLIQELATSGNNFPLKNNNSGFVLPEGMTWDQNDSYHSNPYPCPRQCARIVIENNDDRQILEGGIDLKEATVNIKMSNEPNVEIRALAGQNAFLIKTTGEVKIEPIISEGLPDVENGMRNKISWIKQEIPSDMDWEGMQFAVASAAKGELKAISIATSLESEDVVETAVRIAQEIVDADTKDLIEEHKSIWNNYWSASGIQLDTDILESTWYRSLYFMRCFSKPGVQSVGLFAGLINDTPAWHGDYHTNYNIQQTYWTAYQANHPELAEPYDRLIFEYLNRAEWLAQKVFLMDGAYYPHVMYAYEPKNPEECKSRNGRQYIHHTWGMTIGVNGFTVQPLWWRYKYDPDIDRLRNIVYPVLKKVATFYSNFIENCEGDDRVRLGPSVSPEHWGWTKNLDRNYNCTFDIAYAEYTLKAAIESANILGTDPHLVDRFENSLALLPDYPTSGPIDPVVVDVEGAPIIEYNIPVPTTPIFPADIITWFSSSQKKDLFIRTLENIKWNGNNATFMLAIARARLSLPGSIKWLENVISERNRPNGTISLNTLEPPRRFNDFGHYTEQFGAGMAVTENLLQSVNDIIRIFPSTNKDQNVEFYNLRAQGGFLVSANQNNRVIENVKIESLKGGELKLLSPWNKISGRKNDNLRSESLSIDSLGIVKLKTTINDIWEFKSN